MKSYPRSFPCSAMQLIWCTTYNFYLLICLLSSSFIMFQFGNIQWKGYWKEINEVAIVMKTYWIHSKRHYPRSTSWSAMEVIWCTTHIYYLLICLQSSLYIQFQFGNIEGNVIEGKSMKLQWDIILHLIRRHDSVEEHRNYILSKLNACKLRHH